jgi:regulator of replication initiation timing
MAKTSRALELEPIDRLEEKVRTLVSTLDRLRSDQARLMDENQRLVQEIDALRARMAEAEGAAAEVNGLREERDLVRSRVAEMLQQLEALNI